MREFTLLRLLLFLIIPRTYASSVSMNSSKNMTVLDHCEVLATSEKVIYKNVTVERKKINKTENITKVFWQFKILSTQSIGNSNCPTGKIFELYLFECVLTFELFL